MKNVRMCSVCGLGSEVYCYRLDSAGTVSCIFTVSLNTNFM